ncbi:hypothetical protein O5264_28385, partial [Escherichia coli]|nr:hypothetical protein [Escherichia coli]
YEVAIAPWCWEPAKIHLAGLPPDSSHSSILSPGKRTSLFSRDQSRTQPLRIGNAKQLEWLDGFHEVLIYRKTGSGSGVADA